MAKVLSISVASLLLVAGCSQIIGLSDYAIDPSLDGAAGDASAGGDGSGGKSPGGAGAEQGGEPGAQGGEPGAQGGEPGAHGGEPPVAQAGAGGQGGEGPVIIDCDSADCCDLAGGVVIETELVQNGNFEKGRAAWIGGYVNHPEYEVLSKVDEDSIQAYSGSWYAWLGGEPEDSCYLDSPSFVIPKGTGWITASGYRFFAFDTPEGTGDVACLGLYVAGSSEIAEAFDCWDNFQFDTDDWVDFSYSVPADYVDGNYTLSLVADTDAEYYDDPEIDVDQQASNFFFDDLSLKAATCVEQ